jgi:hypothetical protein
MRLRRTAPAAARTGKAETGAIPSPGGPSGAHSYARWDAANGKGDVGEGQGGRRSRARHLTAARVVLASFAAMLTESESRAEPAPAILLASRRWLAPVRAALGSDFLAAYLTGSVLTAAFDPRRSRVNLLVVARTLDTGMLDRIAGVLPATKRAPHFEPLFLSRRQMEKSLDVFPIEWIEIQERHLLLEGEDVVATLDVPRTNFRLQLEHELRSKQIQLRQTLLAWPKKTAALEHALRASASSFATLFRSLLRLRGEEPPAEAGRVYERTAELFQLDPAALLVPHLLRHSHHAKRAEIPARYRSFLTELDRLINAIDELRVP